MTAETDWGGAPSVLRMILGRQLEELRTRAGLTFEQAGEAIGVSHSTIRRLEAAQVADRPAAPQARRIKILHTNDEHSHLLGFGPISEYPFMPETDGSFDEVARVKISTAMLRSASRLDSSRTYTFMPPASPVPGWSSGDVCRLTIATRPRTGRLTGATGVNLTKRHTSGG